MEGITFLGKHSYRDFGLTLAKGKSIGIPDKEKILVKVPFSNSEYDFSNIYGSQVFSHRELTYPFNIYATGENAKVLMNNKKTQVLNWLMNSNGKQKLYDDAFPNYYFLAEVESGVSFDEDYASGILTVKFNAYPFMIADLLEGNDIWDTFNFELDVSQEVEYKVTGTRTITIINNGTPDVYPTIVSTAPFSLTSGGRSLNVTSGVTTQTNFPLKNGSNVIKLDGTGTVTFRFNKELI